MLRDRRIRLASGFARLTAVALGLAGCSHVGQEEFDSTIAQVRMESREGDERLSASLGGRLDATEDRVAGLEGRTNAMERDLVALAADFDVMVDRMEMAMRVNTPIFFGFDEATLRAEDQELLDRFSAVVHDYYPGSIITVEGFTDASGSREYNLKLGQRRAESVKDYLVTQGQIAPDLIRAVSYGEDHARLISQGSGPGEDGWENRRVVLVVDYGQRHGGMVAQTPQP
jgi:peptidoglycan-associated lipoprotein